MKAQDAPIFLSLAAAEDFINYADLDEDIWLVEQAATDEYRAHCRPTIGEVPDALYEFFNADDLNEFLCRDLEKGLQSRPKRFCSIVGRYTVGGYHESRRRAIGLRGNGHLDHFTASV